MGCVMHSRHTPGSIFSSLLAAAADGLAVYFALQTALWIRFSNGKFPLDPLKGIPTAAEQRNMALLAVLVFLLVFRRLGLYRRPHKGRLEAQIARIIRACLLSFVFYFAAEAALRLDPEFSRLALAFGVPISIVFVLLERWILYRIELHHARHATLNQKVLLLGGNLQAVALAKAIKTNPFLRAQVVGFLRTEAEDDWHADIPENKRIGELKEVERLLEALKPGQVIFCGKRFDADLLDRLLEACEHRYIRFAMVSDLFHASNVRIEQLGRIPVIELDWPLDRWTNRVLKRIFDILFSLFALLLTSPVMLLATLAVKLGSKGPVFYVQERCGEKGQSFRMIKLRTMVADAEANGPGWTTPDDPRRTPVGTFLRKWNIDELPQFLNVLLGHMSVVGPRPERPVYVEQFKLEKERYMRRHLHKPGITGWAQVHGHRGDTSIEERVNADLFYLENWSLGLDVKIIIMTLSSRKNAY